MAKKKANKQPNKKELAQIGVQTEKEKTKEEIEIERLIKKGKQ